MTTRKNLVKQVFMSILTAGVFCFSVVFTSCSDDDMLDNAMAQLAPVSDGYANYEPYGLTYHNFDSESDVVILANATRHALDIVQEKMGNGYADTRKLIHYGYSGSSIQFHQEYNIFYDAGDFFRTQLAESDYLLWKQALDEAVVEKRFARQWRTSMTWRYIYSDFEMTEEKYHGVSMYIPHNANTEHGKYYAQNNEDIKQLTWYQSVGW